MFTIILLCLVTIFYSAYNLLVKASSSNIHDVSLAPILATLSLQVGALSVSLVYFMYLLQKGQVVGLPTKAYGWALVAGLCIGTAEVLYFYLFRGVAGEKPISASVAIPLIVGGTLLISVLVSRLLFNESINTGQWLGIGLAVIGLATLALSSR